MVRIIDMKIFLGINMNTGIPHNPPNDYDVVLRIIICCKLICYHNGQNHKKVLGPAS